MAPEQGVVDFRPEMKIQTRQNKRVTKVNQHLSCGLIKKGNLK
jgi:hypothetical protein